mmetsp:Transcript_30288/g.65489  ORF Transcript_30288/g.65489 Transcript_30288/m.65489 type:complete len:574 (+) Transcript_30288:454-2175(+)
MLQAVQPPPKQEHVAVRADGRCAVDGCTRSCREESPWAAHGFEVWQGIIMERSPSQEERDDVRFALALQPLGSGQRLGELGSQEPRLVIHNYDGPYCIDHRCRYDEVVCKDAWVGRLECGDLSEVKLCQRHLDRFGRPASDQAGYSLSEADRMTKHPMRGEYFRGDVWRYDVRDNPFPWVFSMVCFSGGGRVLLSSGQRKAVAALARGDSVWSPDGAADVVCVVRHTCGAGRAIPLVALPDDGPLLTPGHPVRSPKLDGWGRADQVAGAVGRWATTVVYNFVLSRGHVFDVDGCLCATLGHGFTEPGIADDYLGGHIVADLKKLSGWTTGLVDLPADDANATTELEDHCNRPQRPFLVGSCSDTTSSSPMTSTARRLHELLAAAAQGHLQLAPELLADVHSATVGSGPPGTALRRGPELGVVGAHMGPAAPNLPRLTLALCDFINASLADKSDAWTPDAIAAAVLWGVGFLHPFRDGNGRTARAVAFFILATAKRVPPTIKALAAFEAALTGPHGRRCLYAGLRHTTATLDMRNGNGKEDGLIEEERASLLCPTASNLCLLTDLVSDTVRCIS